VATKRPEKTDKNVRISAVVCPNVLNALKNPYGRKLSDLTAIVGMKTLYKGTDSRKLVMPSDKM
jgi:hypothetical protein